MENKKKPFSRGLYSASKNLDETTKLRIFTVVVIILMVIGATIVTGKHGTKNISNSLYLLGR
jgi:hypothetical protein